MTGEQLKHYFDFYGKSLFTYAMRFTFNKEDAEDLVATVFVKLWECDLTATANIKAWLFHVIKNEGINHRKMKKNRKAKCLYGIDKDEEYGEIYGTNDPDMKIIFGDLLKLVHDETDKFPPGMRTVFQKYFWEGKTFQEIAEELNIPEQIVRNRKTDAVKKLRLLKAIDI